MSVVQEEVKEIQGKWKWKSAQNENMKRGIDYSGSRQWTDHYVYFQNLMLFERLASLTYQMEVQQWCQKTFALFNP